MDSTKRSTPWPRSGRLLAAALAAGTMPIMMISPALARPAAYQGAPARSRTAPIPHAAAVRAAARRARATGKPVLIAPDTTAISTTAANPDGTLTYRLSVLPTRVRVHGTWVPLNPGLARTAAGWRTVAATEPVVLSAGGSGPLAVLRGQAGQRLSLWFPGRLAAPEVSGASATYRSVRPGIDLRLTATGLGGLTQTLIVHTPAAAASTWLRHFALRYTMTRISLRRDAAGTIIASGRHGAAFAIARPVVTGPFARHGKLPARGTSDPDRAAAGSVAVAGDRIVSLAGGSLLSRQARYPVTVMTSVAAIASAPAPAAAPRPGRSGSTSPLATFPSPDTLKAADYIETQDVGQSGGCAAYQNWNSNSVTKLGIGFNAWSPCTGIYQSYWRFDTSGVSNSWIIDHVELNLTENESSWNACSAANEPVYLHSIGSGTGTINSGSDGANVSNLGTASGDNKVTVPPASNPDSGSNCPNQPADFNVTQYGDNISGNSDWTFGASGDNSDNPNAGQFLRLSDNPTLVFTFDKTPPKPTVQQSSPEMMDNPSTPDTNHGCQSSGNSDPQIPWIGAASSVAVKADFEASLGAEDVEPGWDIWNASGTIVNTYQSDVGGGSHSYNIGSPADGDEYFMAVSTQVDGNGQSYDPGYTSGKVDCSFAIDATPPTVPAVTSTAFPPSGGSATSTQTAPGGSGTFSFSAQDPPPSGCGSSSPIAAAGYGGTVSTCLASGVDEFEYSLNNPLPSGSVLPITTTCPGGGQTSGAVAAVNPTGDPTTQAGANPSATTTGTSCGINISQWGTNILYVAAVDTAGNLTQSYQYEFYVPWNSQTKVTPGDVNGDGTPDLLATTSTGNLVLYPGGQDPANGPSIASLAADAPAGVPWNNLDITHRGSWSAGSVDDLFALDSSLGDLWRYTNSGAATGMFEATQNYHSIFYPACTAIPAGEGNQGNCTGYPTSWNAFSQVVAPGDAWAGAPAGSGIIDDTSQPSLLGITSTGALWLFQGSGGQLANPVQLGSSGWNNVTLMAPGTVDGQQTLWARVNSGTDAGDIVSFPLAVPSGQAPTLDPASPGTPESPASGTILTAGGSAIPVTQANYPTVTAAPALTGGTCSTSDPTACPGVYAADATGGLWYYAGQPTTTAAGALAGGSQLVGGVDNAFFAWPLADGSGTTASDSTGGGNPGTLTGGVSWFTDPNRGVVASFDGSTGQINGSHAIMSIRPGFSWSVSAWAYPKTDNTYMDAVSQNGTEVSGFHLDVTSSGFWGFRRPLTDVAGPTYASAFSTTPVQINTWTFLTATFDGTTGNMALYVNGKLAATANDPTPFSTSGPTAVGRGFFGAANTDWWNGYIGSVEGFAYMLTPAEIQTLYAGNGQTLLTQLS